MSRVRRSVPADLEGIGACLSLAFAPYRSRYTPGAYADTVPDSRGLSVRFAAMALFVAENPDGTIVGTIGASASESEGHIRGMAVLPEAQGSGVAAGLLEAAEDELRRLGCSAVTLDTTAPLERAIRFYETNGYRASGKVADFFGMPLYEYRKDLKS